MGAGAAIGQFSRLISVNGAGLTEIVLNSRSIFLSFLRFRTSYLQSVSSFTDHSRMSRPSRSISFLYENVCLKKAQKDTPPLRS